MSDQTMSSDLSLVIQFFLAHDNNDQAEAFTTMDNMTMNPEFQRFTLPETQLEGISEHTLDSVYKTMAFTEENLFTQFMELQTEAYNIGNSALADKLSESWNNYQHRLSGSDMVYTSDRFYEGMQNQSDIYLDFQRELATIIDSDPQMRVNMIMNDNKLLTGSIVGSAMGMDHMEILSGHVQEELLESGYLRETSLDADTSNPEGLQTDISHASQNMKFV